jgi:hypothetical protein
MTHSELSALCGELDGIRSNHIELDEYSFTEQNLQRWHDRDYQHIDPWDGAKSAVRTWA